MNSHPKAILAASAFSLAALVAAGQPAAQPTTPAPAAPAAAAPAPGAPGAPGGRAAGGGAGGGRGGAPAGPVFTSSQKIVYAASMEIPTKLTADITAARTALNTAALTMPRNQADINTKATALATAELALATARATGFQKVQQSPEKLSEEQLTFVRGGGNPLGGGGLSAPGGTMAYEDYTGFTKIFDGSTLTNWDGETDIWTVNDGSIHSESPVQHHIVYVGPGHIVKDFDFKTDMKFLAGANGGIQYRSRRLSGHGPNRSIYDPATIANPLGNPLPAGITTSAAATAAGITGGNPWQVSGYQFDMSADGRYTGQLYEGQGRSIMTAPGEIVQLFPGGIKMTIGRVADRPNDYVKPLGEWNQLEVIARGYTFIHMMNGHVMSVTTDDDPVRRASQGIISLQLESGGQIWYRNVYLKHL